MTLKPTVAGRGAGDLRLLLGSVATLVLLGACASFDGRGLVPGQSRGEEVQARMGVPAEKIAVSNGETLWFYPRMPYGRQSFAVRMGSDGVLRSIEQRLTVDNMMKLMIGTTTAKEVRELLGPPWRTVRFDRQQRDVWEYTIYSADQQEYLLYAQFSPDSTLREVLFLRDPYFEPGGASKD